MKAIVLAAACCTAAALMAGCGGAPPQSTLPGGVVPNVMQHAGSPAPRTWMSPGAKSRDLLYVSDDAGSLYVYTYPQGKLTGTITGLKGPGGLCSDTAGNVYVPETNAQDILVFPHGQRKPSATLLDFGGFPDGCAYDPKSGNLAVTNFATSPSQGPGNVLIFPKASGNPVKYANLAFNAFLFCAYDAKGNLLVDGMNGPSTQPEFAELPAGGKTLKSVTLDTPIVFPGAIVWDGSYFALEDINKGNVYQFSVANGQGTRKGTVLIGKRSKLIVQFTLDAGTLVQPFGATPRASRKVGYWNYPAGGPPAQVVRANGSTELLGVTVSHAP
ncbi:MAG TPA: hypothetical protein VJP76_05200 [Candidatus Tumulicola sp.]|nr:hypothetical protein [Candidatus Tumulicola sp.]